MNRAEQIRVDRGLTLVDVAEQTKLTRQTVRAVEDGNKAIASTLFKLGQFYGVPASTLLGPPVYDQPERTAA